MTDIFFSGFGYWREIDSDGNAIQTVPINRAYKATGVFRLRDDDKLFLEYRNKQDLELMVLLPSAHKDDCFEKDIFGINREMSEFIIDRSKPRTWDFLKAQPIELNHSDNPPNQISGIDTNKLLKLVLGMAIDAYDYDPESDRNSATGERKGISARIATRGIDVHHQTIRKYLDEAKKLL